MSKFETHIRDYYADRLGIIFECRDFGFVGYRIIGGNLDFAEFYVEPNTSYRDTFRLIRDIFAIARSHNCKYLYGCNDTTLSSYEDIKKLHKFFKLVDSGQRDGHREIWVVEL
jgi:hypothetical protein